MARKIILCRVAKFTFRSGNGYYDFAIRLNGVVFAPTAERNSVKSGIGLAIENSEAILENLITRGQLEENDSVIFEVVCDDWEMDTLLWLAKVEKTDNSGKPIEIVTLFENEVYGGKAPTMEELRSINNIEDLR